MELGALVCTATNPSCDLCPVAKSCAWLTDGFPRAKRPAGRSRMQEAIASAGAAFSPSLRTASGPVPQSAFDACWPIPQQRSVTLEALIADGLATRLPSGLIALPGDS